MNRRLLVVAGLTATLLASLAPATGLARTAPRHEMLHVPKGMKIRRADLPRNAKGTVMIGVQLEGRPLAVYQGAALASGKPLDRARKEQLRAAIEREQAVTRARITSLGGHVQFAYTDTFNGFRVAVKAGKVGAIRRLPNVAAILPVEKHQPDNLRTDPYSGASQAWTDTGFTGKGATIAIIDSGINYYHVDFGGAGYDAWQADDGLTKGNDFPTAKVVGGYDLAGDDYNADDENPIRQPDGDPLDCKDKSSEVDQHGTHVAGTAAGFGVTGDGKTYQGPYTTAAIKAAHLRIGPGTAPQAKLLAYRVFGCNGTTYLTTDAIELAVRAGADVISMSLGGTFGSSQSLDALVSDNAALAGSTVVAAAGNEGPSAYVTGSPATGLRVISVAAMDAVARFPAAAIRLGSGSPIQAINANGGPLPVTGRIVHFADDPTTDGDPATGIGFEDLGCDASAFAYNHAGPGDIAVVRRGGCGRVDKAKAGQRADTAAVVMVNNVGGLPPYEDAIPGVQIPFIGVAPAADRRLAAADGRQATIVASGTLANSGYGKAAPFTSAGPGRGGDLLKPDVTAPGVSVFSADGASVAQGKAMSGTSMATPAVAGIAALVKQAHPTWTPRSIKAAIVGTATLSKLTLSDPRFVGAGLVAAQRAVTTKVLAFTDPGASSLSFGYREAAGKAGSNTSWQTVKPLTLLNTGSRAVTYDLANSFRTPSHGVVVRVRPSRVTIPAGGRVDLAVTLSMSRSAAAALPSGAPGHQAPLKVDSFDQLFTNILTVGGAIRLTPRTSGAGIEPLVVPWMVVPRGESTVQDVPGSRTPWKASGSLRTSSLKVRNYGPHSGAADLFAWGLQSGRDGLDGAIDLRAGGVQSLPSKFCDGNASPADRCLVFAINVWGTFDTASANEYDAVLDINHDGDPDMVVSAYDLGLVLDTMWGVTGSIAFDAHTGEVTSIGFARVGTNGSTILLPVLASDLGLRPNGDTDFRWWNETYSYDTPLLVGDVMTTGNADSDLPWFDAFHPALGTGAYKPLKAGATASLPLRLDTADYAPATRGQLGWMIVSLDDANGQFQADLVPVGKDPS
ncbi:MAG: S8 family serine peptidase [Chloroflexota bacterium]